MATIPDRTDACGIARSMAVLGERWTMLIVREASRGVSRFADFHERLGLATDVLSSRLATLVDAGVLDRVPYREQGSRERIEYVLTDAGRGLAVVLGALSDWGAANIPVERGTRTRFVDRETGAQVHVAFVDAEGRAIPVDRVELRPH
jgi:DNA-binding HxlR family transcriptional regulator